jgi:hypothetical protein
MSGAYKDSLFRSLFNDKKAFLSLYNAVSGKNYDENTEVVMTTLTETLFTMRKNDVSGLIGGQLMIATEQQSSPNENMPFRFLSHIARLLENTVVDKSAVYREKLIKLPAPEFIVFCNNPGMRCNRMTLRLSDAFKRPEGGLGSNLELTVTVININKGYNTEIVEKCEPLSGYVEYVDTVRKTQLRITGENPCMERVRVREKAVADSITYCKEHNILKDFFEKLLPEEVNMLAAEWNLEDAIKVAREESWEDGREEGWKDGREKGWKDGCEEGREKERELFSKLMRQAKSMDDLKKMFETSYSAQS